MKRVNVAFPAESYETRKSKGVHHPKIPSRKSDFSTLRLWVKLIVCICCLFGFVYQTTQFALIYLDYPVILDIQVKSPHEIPVPAITFCTNNHVLRSKFCATYPEDCRQYLEVQQFCGDLPYLCDYNLTFATEESLRFTGLNSVAKIREVAPTEEDFVLDCGIKTQSGYDSCNLNVTYIGTRGIQFELHSCFKVILIESEDQVPKLQKYSDFIMWITFQQEEYAFPRLPISYKIALHEPNSHVSPYFEGTSIEPGKVYSLSYNIEEKWLLPPPYQTMCTDYMQQWNANGGTGPTTQFMCNEECKRQYSIANCNCTDLHILLLYPDDVACPSTGMDCLTPENVKDCLDKCTQACFSHKYILKIEEDEGYRNPSVNEDIYRRHPNTRALITLLNAKTDIITYNYKPQYMSIEILSYVGGYVGIWLGISLVAVFNFLESFVVQLPDILHERKKKKMKKQARLFAKEIYK